MTSRRLLVGGSLVAVLVLSACSSGTDPGGSSTSTPTTSSTSTTSSTASATATASGSPAPAEVTSAVTAAVGDWLNATSPEAACAAASRGFSQFLGNDGQNTTGSCVDHILDTLGGSLQHGPFTVQAVELSDGQAFATVSIPSATPAPVVYWFVQEGSAWKLNSIGRRRPAV